ncbi:AAA family ATPase [Brevibacillus sp. SIMBA_040]|uniref:AAA family ATPase n=1 Tax=unclassified Brevibacillus TaxID=2684853 RepID=UPI00397C03E1
MTRPYVPPGMHPIETGRYLLATPVVDRLFEVVSDWFEERATGGIIYGRPRFGKTRAIKYLMNVFPIKFGVNVPVYNIKCKQYKRVNEGTFFEDLLNDIGHGFPFSNKTSVKRDRLQKYLIEKADASGLKRVVFFMDDAQRLVDIQYDWLMDIYNELDDHGITMSVFLVGQPELEAQRSSFISAHKYQIVGRFMVRQEEFKGLTNIEEIRSCLTGYDEDCEYPENSGWSFTRYFFPEAYEDGEKLENCAGDLIVAFDLVRKEAGIFNSFELPMKYLTTSIEYCLKKFGANGLNEYWPTQSHWKEAIEKSGYKESEFFL